MKRILSLLLVLLMLPLTALGESTVTVSGQATVSLEPDSVCVTIGVQNYEDNVLSAMTNNAAAIAAVTEAVKQNGAVSVTTASFSLNASYDYSSSVPRMTGYQVNHMLTVTLDSIDGLGALLDAAGRAGANEVYNISYASSQSDNAYEQALQAAVAQARRDAEILAAASGMKLGSIVTLTENSSVNHRIESKAAGSNSYRDEAATAIVPDGLDYSAYVTIVYELLEQ